MTDPGQTRDPLEGVPADEPAGSTGAGSAAGGAHTGGGGGAGGPGFDPSAAGNLGRRVEEAVKRVVMGGVGALFMTEEGIRNIVGDLKLPREAASYLVGQTERTKEDVLRAVGREVRRFLDGVQMDRELRKLLSTMDVEIKATIRFKEREDGALEPEVVHRDVRTERRE